MRAVEHYLEAERLAAVGADPANYDGPFDSDADRIAQGQLHATLALAGATAMQAYVTGDSAELEDWEIAAGSPA